MLAGMKFAKWNQVYLAVVISTVAAILLLSWFYRLFSA
jgi:hypothetical protein